MQDAISGVHLLRRGAEWEAAIKKKALHTPFLSFVRDRHYYSISFKFVKFRLGTGFLYNTFMKYFLTLAFFAGIAILALPQKTLAAYDHLAGRIVLQVQAHGEAWYINPPDLQRYYLGRPTDAWNIMRDLGVGVSNADLARIPTPGVNWDGDQRIMPHAVGRILIQVEEKGEAWYVNPADGKRYYLGRPADAFKIMSELGLGISNEDLAGIGISDRSLESNPEPEPPLILSVPFTAQAPHGNWSAPYNEACEESILVMLDHYFRGQPLSLDQANHEILELVDWQNTNFGYYEDTGVEKTAEMIEGNYNWDYRISRNVSKESIKAELQKGNPVLLPLSGRDLGNPYFRGGGPIYHMLVVIGFHEDRFITNEPGTRNGAMYQYQMDTLVNAVHDLTDPESAIRTGEPAMLIIEP